MKSVVLPTLLTALLMLGGRPACAALNSGIAINWGGCLANGVVQTQTFDCNTNTGEPFELYVSLVLPADVPEFAATTVIVDVYTSRPSVPPWWQTATGQCRAGAVGVSYDPNTFPESCPDIWAGQQPLQVFQVQAGVHGLPYEIRLNSGAAVPVGAEISWVADGQELTVCKYLIQRRKSTGADACAGCTNCAMLVPSECFVQQPWPLPSYRLTGTWSSDSRRWWNGSCDPTPTQNRSWGQIKGLYR